MNLLPQLHRLLFSILFIACAFSITIAQQIEEQSYEQLVTLLQHDDSATRLQAVQKLRDLGDSRAFMPLSRQVHDADPLVRGQVIVALGNLAGLRALPLLKNALNDEHILVSTQAVEAIGHISHVKASSLLISILRDSKSPLRNAAATALGEQSPERSFDTLLRYCNDADPELRVTIINVLASMDDNQEIHEPRVKALRLMLNDAEVTVRVNAILALAKITDDESVPVFSELLHDDNSEIRRAAISSLDELNVDDLLNYYQSLLTDPDQSLRELAINKLSDATVDEQLLAALLTFAHDEDGDIRREVYQVVNRFATENENDISEPLIIKFRELITLGIKDENKQVQLQSVLLAQRFPDIPLRESLITLLLNMDITDNQYEFDQWNEYGSLQADTVISALLAINDQDVFDKLITYMTELTNEKRYAIWNALGNRNDSRIDKLLEELQQQVVSAEDKNALIEAISTNHESPKRVITLSKYLTDNDENVFNYCTARLSGFGDVGWQYLYSALSGENSIVRQQLMRLFINRQYFDAKWEEQAANSAIPELRLLVTAWRIRTKKPVEEATLLALLHLKDPAIQLEVVKIILYNDTYKQKMALQIPELLTSFLETADAENRLQIALLLAICDDKRAIPLLEDAIFSRDEALDEYDEQSFQYINALFSISAPEALEHVEDMLDNDNDFPMISELLLKRDDKQATEILLNYISANVSSDWLLTLSSAPEDELAEDNQAKQKMAHLQYSIQKIGISFPAPFIAALADPRPEMRALTVILIGEANDARMLENLLPMLQDDDQQVRMAAYQVYETHPDLQTFPVLLALLKSESGEASQSAARALGMIGDLRALPALLTAFKAGEKKILAALLLYQDARVAEVLADILEDKQLTSDEKYQVITALAILSNEKSISLPTRKKIISALKRIANDDKQSFRQQALLVLMAYGDNKMEAELRSLILEGSPDEIKVIISILPYIHDGTVVKLIATEYVNRFGFIPNEMLEFIKPFTADGEIAGIYTQYAQRSPADMTAVELLRALKNSKVEADSQLMLDATPSFCEKLISSEIMNRLTTQPNLVPEILPTLLSMAKSGVGAVKLDAILLLGYINNVEAQKLLISLLKAKRDDIRAHALLALAELHPMEAHEAIVDLAGDQDNNVQIALAYTLGKYAEKSDYDILKVMLENKNSKIVRQTIIAIGVLKDERAITVLTTLLNEGWIEAAIALGNFNVPEVTKLLVSAMHYPPLLKNASFAEERNRQLSVSAGLSSSDSKEDTMRYAAMRALCSQGGKPAVDELMTMIEIGSLVDRALAAELLGKMGDKRAVPLLITALERFPDNFPMLTTYNDIGPDYSSEYEFEMPYMFPTRDAYLINAKSQALTALQTLTGQKFSANPEEWRNWWTQNNNIQ